MTELKNQSYTSTPEWVQHAIFYQIFPDRFARSTRVPHPPGIQFREWGAPPREQGYQGGDLYGIIDKLDYLTELGINALYLNPVFSSASNHRYHTYDYLAVDPLLGGNAALRDLLDAAHGRGIKVILDGVFNHASRGFWPFHHVLENGGDSPYIDWFHIENWPLNPYPASSEDPPNYGAWWGLHALPKLNVRNPGMRAYLLQVAAYWMEFGADGWRLDVPQEIDDVSFWREFRHVVRDANPDAYLVGEIWHDAQEWLRGDRFDAVMNYAFSRACLGFFGANTLRTEERPGGYELQILNAEDFAATIDHNLSIYDWHTTKAQLNLLDSHDTARALWLYKGDESALRLSVLFQMTMPGAPCIYYGDEIGMTGATDPDSRGAFPWDARNSWNDELLEQYRRAIQLRHDHDLLRTGLHRTVYAKNDIYGFLRWQKDAATSPAAAEAMLVLINTKRRRVKVNQIEDPLLGDGARWTALWNQGEYTSESGTITDITVPARDAIVLKKVQSTE